MKRKFVVRRLRQRWLGDVFSGGTVFGAFKLVPACSALNLRQLISVDVDDLVDSHLHYRR